MVFRYNNLEIKSYDDIYEFAVENYETSLIAIPIIQNWDILYPDLDLDKISTKDLIVKIVCNIVENPEDVSVVEVAGEMTNIYELRVSGDDLGKVIGRQGRTAKAIRTVLNAIAIRKNKRFELEVIAPDGYFD
ncbi:KH domain-containing protein [bacterium]|nr:KH domain-containing protein [bacterium]